MTLVTTPYDHDGVPVLTMLRDMTSAAMQSLIQTTQGVPREGGLWHDQPVEDECCDGLYTWVRSWVPVADGEFPVQAATTQRCQYIDMTPQVVLSLRRPCAPTPDERGKVRLEQEVAAAEDLILDARALTCGVFGTWPPLLQALWPGSRLFYGPMVATGGNTNCFGWDWEVSLEIHGCRGACSP